MGRPRRTALASLIPPDRANPSGAGNVLATLVRHPDLTAAYLPFNAYLLRNSTLSPRIREVALLRVVCRGNCDYLWTHHVPIAVQAGLSPEDMSGIRSGNCPDRHDQLVIQAVDDLIADSTITQATWEELGQVFTDDTTHGSGLHDRRLSLAGYGCQHVWCPGRARVTVRCRRQLEVRSPSREELM